ncbi:MAG: DnaA/Hda family protein [Chlamydiota bacterium]
MKAWLQFLKRLEGKLGKKTVDDWLRPLHIVKFDARNLYLDAQDAFHIHWFYEHIQPKWLDQLQAPSGHSIAIYFSLKGRPFKGGRKKNVVEKSPTTFFAPGHLEPQAQLESFLTSDQRHLPFEVVKDWVKRPLPLKLEGENPLYFYGSSGSGKTHLLMGIAHKLKKRAIRAFYVHTEAFTEHVVRAFRSSMLQEFRQAYREIEVLLIDDIHLLARKAGTQEEFFHTFNRLHGAGCPIIITANCPPQQLEGIEERLVSRFEWGLTLPACFPTQELRRKILEQRSKPLGVSLNEALTYFLLATFESLSSLIRALEALALRNSHAHGSIDPEVAQCLLSDLIAAEKPNCLSSEKIITRVAHYFGTTPKHILGRSQNKECVLPRQIAMYLCREKLHLPYTKIGRIFSRDHSTVISSVKLIIQAKREKNKAISLPLQAIESRLVDILHA